MRLYRAHVVAVAAALVVGALALPATTAQGSPRSASRPPAGAAASGAPVILQTPVLSLRRAPELLATAVGAAKLGPALDAALSDPRLGGVPSNTCLVVQAGPAPLYVHNPTLPLIPASNLKLLTATAALDKLPSGDRLVTSVRSDAPPANGTVGGNLYLVGGGDPILRTPDYVATLRFPAQIYDNLNTLADQVRAAGVTQVGGSIVGDESRYDTKRSVATWPARYATNGEVGPLSALSVNDGFATFKPAVAAAAPAQQAAAAFAALLRDRGIKVAGTPSTGTAPSTAAKITELASAPLPDVVGEVLRRSDNNGAELITKEIGRQASPATATTAAGVAAILAAVQADGLPAAGLHMVDGSGLDRSDRATCQLILAALLRSGPEGLLGRGLAVAGKSGTLFRRMIGTPAAGRLRAKTGSLEGVSALSGFVTPAPAPAPASPGFAASDVAFSLITNAAPSLAAGDALADKVGVLLAQFPQAPPVTVLAPLDTP